MAVSDASQVNANAFEKSGYDKIGAVTNAFFNVSNAFWQVSDQTNVLSLDKSACKGVAICE